MLMFGLRIGSIVQWKAIQGADGVGHVYQESLSIYVDKSINGEQVCEALEKIKAASGLPRLIKVDYRSEFIACALEAWSYFNKVKIDCAWPCMPTDNLHIESFNEIYGMNAYT